MTGETLQSARKQRGWTQTEAGARLGVSQTYVALLESGQRPVPPKLARRAVQVFKLSPAHLCPSDTELSKVTTEELTRNLGRLGYPGFAYLRGGRLKNPAEVLLAALAQAHLDSRVAEALPWVLLHFPDADQHWLITQARMLSLTNRLGFVVDLALRVAEREADTNSTRYAALARLRESLRLSRLDLEDTLGQEFLSDSEREWLRANRPPEAQFWHMLSDWRPELLQYR